MRVLHRFLLATRCACDYEIHHRHSIFIRPTWAAYVCSTTPPLFVLVSYYYILYVFLFLNRSHKSARHSNNITPYFIVVSRSVGMCMWYIKNDFFFYFVRKIAFFFVRISNTRVIPYIVLRIVTRSSHARPERHDEARFVAFWE